MIQRTAFAPGRVTIIGEHTDYNDGRSLAMALRAGTTATSVIGPGEGLLIRTSYDGRSEAATLTHTDDLEKPGRYSWAALVAFLASHFDITSGGLEITSDLPIGAGLSSSASLAMAVAMSFGATGEAFDLARLCQQAERAAGSDVGLLDQVTICAGRANCAVAIDFATEQTALVTLPENAEWVVIHSGQSRSLATSSYAQRRKQCEQAAAVIGPLGLADESRLVEIDDPIVRARARHVITECERVIATEHAFRTGDLATVGSLLFASHASLSKEFACSTPRIDAMVGDLTSTPGIYGARMVGGGFGGCILALCEPGSLDPTRFSDGAWIVTAGAGATVLTEQDAN